MRVRNENPINAAFHRQKNTAAHRGIAFNFTLQEWKQWWLDQLGENWFSLRGVHKGQYVMARHGDKGHYEHGNVKCITAEANHKEAKMPAGEDHCLAKLDHAKVLEARQLYISGSLEFGCNALARKFGVSRCTMQDCLSRYTWRNI